MRSFPFIYKKIGPYLRGIEQVQDVPLNFHDLAAAREFYGLPKNVPEDLDTSTAIIWDGEGRFKISTEFFWEKIKPRQLSDSALGSRTSIELLLLESGRIRGSRFCLVSPIENVETKYALVVNRAPRKKEYSEKEIRENGGGIIGVNLEKAEAYHHPVWKALLGADLKQTVDWVWEQSSLQQGKAMAIHLQDPLELALLLWKQTGVSNGFAARAHEGFDKEKHFLYSSFLAERES